MWKQTYISFFYVNIKFDHVYDTYILSHRGNIILSSIVLQSDHMKREATAGGLTWGNEIGSSIILL